MREHDTVVLCATDRETTRGLIEAIAAKLAARWDESASVPAAAQPASPEVTDDVCEEPEDEQSTLDQMLVATGRRPRKARREV